MDNFSILVLGAGLTAGGTVLFRGSQKVGVRAMAAAAMVPGAIMLFVALVNALSGTG